MSYLEQLQKAASQGKTVKIFADVRDGNLIVQHAPRLFNRKGEEYEWTEVGDRITAGTYFQTEEVTTVNSLDLYTLSFKKAKFQGGQWVNVKLIPITLDELPENCSVEY
jgi:hypothetical protein